jgi:beta-1,4-mannosyl-glycoprotein beta-1,4-N-acetylglucosaminyltransferase
VTQVWDAFLFNDELEVLELRLAELDPVVERFVIVEGNRTFAGRPKPLHFDADRFRSYHHKIRHVVVDVPAEASSDRERERAQHAGLAAAISDLPDDSYVIIGDVDEIPSRDALAAVAATVGDRPVRMVLHHALYYANWRLPTPWTDGPKLCRRAHLDLPELGPLLGVPTAWDLEDDVRSSVCGWHLSYLGGPVGIDKKLADFPGQEFDTVLQRSTSHLRRCLEYQVDFRGTQLLEIVPEADLDAQLSRVEGRFPHLFSFRRPAAGWKRSLYQSYARSRRKLPPSVVRWADEHLLLFLSICGPALVAADRLIHWRRRRRSVA